MRVRLSTQARGENSSVRRSMPCGAGKTECSHRTIRLSLRCPTCAQRWSRLSRAARRPALPLFRASPPFSAAPFKAPADVPLMAEMVSQSSSSNRSRTPQEKAPCAPPPCKARLIRRSSIAAPAFAVQHNGKARAVQMGISRRRSPRPGFFRPRPGPGSRP